MDDFLVIARIAAALCEDARIRLAPSGGGWAWSATQRTIFVDTDDLAATGIDACAGIVAHEVGHARVTRGELADGPDLAPPLRHLLHNVLEDPRCEAWIADRYPGTAPWLVTARTAHASRDLTAHPPFMQAALAWAHPASLDTAPLPFRVAAEVEVVVRETRAARLAYRATRPSGDLTGWWDATLAPHAEPAWRAEPGESGVLAAAHAAADLADRAIRPRFAALVEADVDTLARALASDTGETERALDARDWPAVVALAARGARPTTTTRRRAADRIAERVVGTRRQIGPASLAAGRPGRTRGHPPRPRPIDPQARLQRVEAPAHALERALAPLFPPRRAGWSHELHSEGQRPSMPALLRFEADPTASRRIWHRRSPPRRRSAAVLLLVDLSGSMARGRIEPALDGVLMLVLALGRLDIPLGVYGFQDQLVPILPFDRRWSAAPLPELDRMALEVHGEAPGGNNQPQYNDDGPCLDEAACILAARPESDRVLLVVSDGRPEGRRSGVAELQAAVRRWTGSGSPVRLVGIGLGAQATHISKLYPDAVAGVLPADLPLALGGTLARRLGVGGGGRTA